MWPQRVRLPAAALSLTFLVSFSVPFSVVLRKPQESQAVGEPEQHRAAVLHPAALRPVVTGRAAWHADEKDVRQKPLYDGSIRAVFVHQTDNPNTYDCTTDVPGMLLAMEQYHIAQGWDDLGYNFVVDRCGNIYEGRAGGIDRAVRGAHTEGFNIRTVGIAALGTFDAGDTVPRPMLQAIASIAAWKLDPGVNPMGRVRLVSSNDQSRFPKGTSVEVNAISGHRDVFETLCPGQALYDDLPWIRRAAAQLRTAATWPN